MLLKNNKNKSTFLHVKNISECILIMIYLALISRDNILYKRNLLYKQRELIVQ